MYPVLTHCAWRKVSHLCVINAVGSQLVVGWLGGWVDGRMGRWWGALLFDCLTGWLLLGSGIYSAGWVPVFSLWPSPGLSGDGLGSRIRIRLRHHCGCQRHRQPFFCGAGRVVNLICALCNLTIILSSGFAGFGGAREVAIVVLRGRGRNQCPFN